MSMRRVSYYALSSCFSVLGIVYCFFVYRSGQDGGLDFGTQYLSGVPNYYLFYTLVLPFIAAGILYLAFENRFIRFFGKPSPDLDEKLLRKIKIRQRIFPVLCVLISALVVAQDAVERGHTLPPYAYNLQSVDQRIAVTNHFACAKGWKSCDEAESYATPEAYLQILNNNALPLSSVTGFSGLGEMWASSSALYKLELTLSFLAALLISVFLAQVYMLITVKNLAKQATKNLIVWMLLLGSFWFPTKLYTSWKFTIGEFTEPLIVWFGLFVLVLGTLLVLFILSQRNELVKFGGLVVGLFSTVLGIVSYVSPEYLHQWVELVWQSGQLYAVVVAVLLAIGLYVVTDYFINCYEEETSASP